mmetsp:Transcript_28913/g.92396  ORF Transcript_28913/g.92396 Transcript_28913/m.92396 type:complete len:221 (-) Transcript_28913:136-798(-)
MLSGHLGVIATGPGGTEGEAPKRVLVPLAGKTVDVPFLAAQGFAVVATEGVEQAVEEFAAEQPELGMSWAEPEGAFRKSVASDGSVTFMLGDHFQLTEGAAGGAFDGVYDRASLVAILPEHREAYVDVMANVVRPGGHILLVTFERRKGEPEAMAAGPPFSIPEAAVRELYEKDGRFEVALLEDKKVDISAGPMARMAEAGIEELRELAFLVKRSAKRRE